MAVLDSQSVKISCLTNNSVGYNGDKKIKGRKRHVLVDTLGLVLRVVVTAANVSAPAGAKLLLKQLKGHRRWLQQRWVVERTFG